LTQLEERGSELQKAKEDITGKLNDIINKELKLSFDFNLMETYHSQLIQYDILDDKNNMKIYKKTEDIVNIEAVMQTYKDIEENLRVKYNELYLIEENLTLIGYEYKDFMSLNKKYEILNILQQQLQGVQVAEVAEALNINWDIEFDFIIGALEHINYDSAIINVLKLHQNLGLNNDLNLVEALDLSRVLYNRPELYLPYYEMNPEKFFEAYKMQKQVEIDYNYETMFENVKEIMSQLG